MSWKHWLMVGAIASSITTTNTQEPVRSHQELTKSAIHIGPWAEYSLKNTTQSFKDTVRIGDRNVQASYNTGRQHLTFTKPYTDDPRNRNSLAHELSHYLLDNRHGTKGLLEHPDYSGPTREELLEHTRNWYSSDDMYPARENLEVYLEILNQEKQQQLAKHHTQLEPVLESYKPFSNLKNNQYIQDRLANFIAEPTKLPQILRVFAVPNYQEHNQHIDELLNYLQGQHNQIPHNIKHPQLHNIHETIHQLQETRNSLYNEALIDKEFAQWYFTDPEETLARAMGSLIEQYTGQSTRHQYQLNDQILNKLAQMTFKGESLFEKHINNYQKLRQTYAATTASSSE